MEKDDLKHDKSLVLQDEDETPSIYAVSRTDGKTTVSRRSFLEIAVVAGTAILSNGFSTLAEAEPKAKKTKKAKKGAQTGPAYAHKTAVTTLAVNTSGKLLASGDKDGTLKLWQLPEGALLHSWQGHKNPIVGLSFPNMDNALWSLDSYGTMKGWLLPDGKETSDKKFNNFSLKSNSMFAVPSAGDWYAVLTSSGSLELRSQKTDEKLGLLEGLDANDNVLTATSDGSLLLFGGSSGKLSLWAEANGTRIQTITTGAAAVSALAMAPHGTLALSAHADGSLRTWQLPELRPMTSYQSTLGKPFSVAIRPQLDLFVVASEKPEIGLWRLAASAGEPKLLTGHAAAVRAIVITPDGSLLISGSEDKTIRLWSLPDGKYLRNLVDMNVNYDYIKGAGYEGKDVFGRSVTFTLPCGSPIPPGAVCTCNCVPGAMSIPNNHKQSFSSSGYCTCDLICTCNTICTCQSVGGSGYSVGYWYPN